MRIVLRDRDRGLFYREPGVWVSEIAEAKTFSRSMEAIDLATVSGLAGVEVYFSFEDPAYDFSLPIAPGQGVRAPWARAGERTEAERNHEGGNVGQV